MAAPSREDRAYATRFNWDISVKRGAMAGLISIGWTDREAAEHVGYRHPATAARAAERAIAGLGVKDAPRSGRPSSMTPQVGARLLELADEPAFAVGAPTFQRRLKQEGVGPVPGLPAIRNFLKSKGYAYRSPKGRLDISERNKTRRYEWALQNRRQPWTKVCWSDSTKFKNGPEHGTYLAKSWMQDKSPRTVKLPQFSKFCVHAYAAISSQGSTDLILVTGTRDGQRYLTYGNYRNVQQGTQARGVTAKEYKERVLHKLIAELKHLWGSYDFIFMQDGAAAHGKNSTKQGAGKKIKAYLDKKGVKLLPWTAKMADLNPIEHAWGATQTVIWNKELKNPSPDLETFIHVCQTAWKEVTGTPQQCRNFTRHHRAKVERLIRRKGDQI